MDFPAPVSPVRTERPDGRSRSNSRSAPRRGSQAHQHVVQNGERAKIDAEPAIILDVFTAFTSSPARMHPDTIRTGVIVAEDGGPFGFGSAPVRCKPRHP